MKQIIQVAGVIDFEEAQMLIDCGVDWLGFPLRLTHNAEDLSEAAAAKLISKLPSQNRSVLITYLTEPDEIIQFCQDLGTKTAQLHNQMTIAQLSELRKKAPDFYVLKSLVVRQNNSAELQKNVDDCSPFVDAFITDTFDPETGASGATGKTHDWQVSKNLVEISPKPVMLAGGLNPENVREAIQIVKPAAVDAHTGLEGPDGRKKPELVKKFIREANEGFRCIK